MLYVLVGPVDWNSAAVLIVLFAGVAVAGSIFIANRRSRLEIDNDFKLAKMKIEGQNEEAVRLGKRQHEMELAKIAANREVELKRIDENMLTSHVRDASNKG